MGRVWVGTVCRQVGPAGSALLAEEHGDYFSDSPEFFGPKMEIFLDFLGLGPWKSMVFGGPRLKKRRVEPKNAGSVPEFGSGSSRTAPHHTHTHALHYITHSHTSCTTY